MERIHIKPFQCDFCVYACKSKHTLNIHRRIHTGEKSYKCDVCEYACNTKSNLIKHQIIHSGEKPFQCDDCEYACNANAQKNTYWTKTL